MAAGINNHTDATCDCDSGNSGNIGILLVLLGTDSNGCNVTGRSVMGDFDVVAAALDHFTGGKADEDIVVAGLDGVPGGSADRGIVAAGA